MSHLNTPPMMTLQQAFDLLLLLRHRRVAVDDRRQRLAPLLDEGDGRVRLRACRKGRSQAGGERRAQEGPTMDHGKLVQRFSMRVTGWAE